VYLKFTKILDDLNSREFIQIGNSNTGGATSAQPRFEVRERLRPVRVRTRAPVASVTPSRNANNNYYVGRREPPAGYRRVGMIPDRLRPTVDGVFAAFPIRRQPFGGRFNRAVRYWPLRIAATAVTSSYRSCEEHFCFLLGTRVRINRRKAIRNIVSRVSTPIL